MSELHAAIHALEERLLGTWTRQPGLRAAWTPAPDEFLGPRTQAVAAGCASVAAAAFDGVDLGSAVVSALHGAGKLKLWELGAPVVSHLDERDPIGALQRWRELHALLRLKTELAKVEATITARSDLGTVRAALHDALRRAEANAPVTAYTDEALMALALQGATTKRVAGHGTGFPLVDNITGGLRAGHCWVFGAPTNYGKTSLLLAVLDHCQGNGRRSLLVSCEDAPELLGARLLARRANLSGTAVRDGKLTEHQLGLASDELVRARARGNAPILIDGRGRDVEHIAGDIRAAVRAHGIEIVMVDYLQAISTSRDSQDRRNEINFIARTLTDAVKTSGAAGLFASQLTGEDIRESRDVEHAAEVVLIGRKSEDGAMQLFVKKNKTGPKDSVIDLQWDPRTGAFATHQPAPETDQYDGVFEDRYEPASRWSNG
jgi:KaiC/GvpD/RAD55 family RecA-like ATPase